MIRTESEDTRLLQIWLLPYFVIYFRLVYLDLLTILNPILQTDSYILCRLQINHSLNNFFFNFILDRDT